MRDRHTSELRMRRPERDALMAAVRALARRDRCEDLLAAMFGVATRACVFLCGVMFLLMASSADVAGNSTERLMTSFAPVERAYTLVSGRQTAGSKCPAAPGRQSCCGGDNGENRHDRLRQIRTAKRQRPQVVDLHHRTAPK